MDYDDALTVVLTLKDRAAFTARWMTYANNIRLPFKVLIADGGKDESVERVLSRADSYPNVRYEYVRYPYDESYTHYYEKLADALSKVETPFVVLADNDDFYFVDGLRRSAEFLDSNPGYASCRGIGGGFTIAPGVDDSLSGFYGDKVRLIIPQNPPSVLDETAAERVERQFSAYCPTFYDVHRSHEMRDWFGRLAHLDPDNVLIAELLTSFLAVASGKIERGPFLYLIRQKASPSSNSTADRARYGDYFNRMLADTWSADLTGFADSLADAISATDGVRWEQAKAHVKRGFRRQMAPLVTRSLSLDLRGASKSPIRRLRDRVVDLPSESKTRRATQRVYRGYAAGRGFAAHLLRRRSGIREMSLSRPSVYRDELRPVYDVLRAPPVDLPSKVGRSTEAV